MKPYLVLLLISWNSLAAGASHCLSRSLPDGTSTNATYETLVDWSTDGVLIHAQKNEIGECKDPSNSCHTGILDMFFLTQYPTDTDFYEFRLRRSSASGEDLIAQLKVNPDKTYLYGTTLVSKQTIHVVVLFSGVKACSFTNFNYPVAKCATFQLELYPDNKWKAYRPDQATWKSGVCAATGGAMQPGGGGGHDPPVHP